MQKFTKLNIILSLVCNSHLLWKKPGSSTPVIGSITSCCSGKWARPHPPKERLDACNFLCWLKPIMLPPADFRLAKIVAEIIKSKQKVLPWSIAWRSDFDGPETLGKILESEGTQRFVRLFVVNFSFKMIVVGQILHLQASLQGDTAFVTDVTVHVYIWQRNIQYAGNSVW